MCSVEKEIKQINERCAERGRELIGMQRDIKHICEKQDEIHSDVKELRKEIKENYAGIWVEGAIKWVAILIIGAVIASLLNQVLK